MRSSRRQFIESILGLPIAARAFGAPAQRPARSSRVLQAAPPMVGRVTGTAAEVSLHVAARQRARVRWGADPRRLDAQMERNVERSATFTLTNLPPGEIHYRVDRRFDGAAQFTTGLAQRFRTQRRRGESYRFAVLADAHLVRGGEDAEWYQPLRQIASRLAEEDLDFVVFMGDESTIDGSGRDEQAVRSQQEAFERYAALRRVYAPLLERSPAFFVLGNHDGERLYKPTIQDGAQSLHLLRWGAIARKRYLLNPGPDTYPEGGENQGWKGPDGDAALGGADEGHASPLHNYYAWTWGDATFVVLDPFRYTPVTPDRPEQWTLGSGQRAWMQRVLRASDSTHKFVICHQLVGGAPVDASVTSVGAYGRGGARFADRGEQAMIHATMVETGVRHFLYGHDHIVAHEQRDGVNYLCCGRPWRLSGRWWDNPGWSGLYGSEFTGLPGAMIIDVTPESVTARYVVTQASSPVSTHWDAPRYRVGTGGTIELPDRVHEVVRVWASGRPDRDLFRGGSVADRTITLGKRWRGTAGAQLHVLYVGQTAFRRRFS